MLFARFGMVEQVLNHISILYVKVPVGVRAVTERDVTAQLYVRTVNQADSIGTKQTTAQRAPQSAMTVSSTGRSPRAVCKEVDAGFKARQRERLWLKVRRTEVPMNGDAVTMYCRRAVTGLTGPLSIFDTMSIPSRTSPNTTCLPSNQLVTTAAEV